MNAFVTGASGFIGSRLVHKLVELDWEVSILTRYGNVCKNPRLADVWDRLTVHEGDLRNRWTLKDIDAWVVFHLAAYNHVGSSWDQVEECFDVNAKGTANALDSITWARFVYVSSSEVYGYQNKTPWVETMKPHPQSPYAITKYAGELYAQAKRDAGEAAIIVRPFNAYGPGQSTKAVIPEMIRQIQNNEAIHMTKGVQTREFVYVDDIVDGLIRAAQVTLNDSVLGPINLATGHDVQIRRLPEIIGHALGKKPNVVRDLPYRTNEIWKMVANAEKARKTLGWKPKVGFAEGIKRTVEWFKGNR